MFKVQVISNTIKLEMRIAKDGKVSLNNHTILTSDYTDESGNDTPYTIARHYMVFETEDAAIDFRSRYPDLVVEVKGQ